MMRQLVRAGILSVPAVTAAVRIQAGQVMMAEAHGELPRGVREALGDSPEVRGMRVTDKAGAGMAEPPRHHVMPKEFRADRMLTRNEILKLVAKRMRRHGIPMEFTRWRGP